MCDVYDALRTKRPYRDAWPVVRVLPYIEGRTGLEFDPEYVNSFIAMMRKWESQVAVVADERAPLPASPPMAPPAPDATPPSTEPGVSQGD